MGLPDTKIMELRDHCASCWGPAFGCVRIASPAACNITSVLHCGVMWWFPSAWSTGRRERKPQWLQEGFNIHKTHFHPVNADKREPNQCSKMEKQTNKHEGTSLLHFYCIIAASFLSYFFPVEVLSKCQTKYRNSIWSSNAHKKKQQSLFPSLIVFPPITMQYVVPRIPETMATAGYQTHLWSSAPPAVDKMEVWKCENLCNMSIVLKKIKQKSQKQAIWHLRWKGLHHFKDSLACLFICNKLLLFFFFFTFILE